MQLTQRKRKNITVRSEEKAESAFAPTPGKPIRLFLLDKIIFSVPKAKSALSPFLAMPSRLFLLSGFSNLLLSYPLKPFGPCILIHIVLLLFVVLGDYILMIIIY